MLVSGFSSLQRLYPAHPVVSHARSLERARLFVGFGVGQAGCFAVEAVALAETTVVAVGVATVVVEGEGREGCEQAKQRTAAAPKAMIGEPRRVMISGYAYSKEPIPTMGRSVDSLSLNDPSSVHRPKSPEAQSGPYNRISDSLQAFSNTPQR